MNEPQSNPVDRRTFLQAGVAATAAGAALLGSGASAQDPQPGQDKLVLPTRTLGR